MTVTPSERLERLLRHVRQGWRRVLAGSAARARARSWLMAHPSRMAAVDALWLECLEGRGCLHDWLTAGSDPERWPGPQPLHSVLASHPFPDLPPWSSPTT